MDMISDMSITAKGLVIKVDGKEVRVADHRFFSRDAAWHRKGYERVFAQGLYASDALYAIDPLDEMGIRLDPVVRLVNGKLIRLPYASVVTHQGRSAKEGGEVIYGLVKTGKMTKQEWIDMNPSGIFTKSHQYEIIAPRRAAQMVQDLVRDEQGSPIRLNSAGFLGKDGDKGMFMSLPMPSFGKSTTDALGTDVQNQFTIYLDWDGVMKVYLTPTIVVCMNTLMASFGNAVTMLKTGHAAGAEDRFAQALKGVYDNAMEANEIVQDAMLFLLDKQLNRNQVQEVAEAMFFLPGEPDAQYLGKDDARRWYNYNQNLRRAEANRAAFVQVVEDKRFHEFAGITPQMITGTPGMYSGMAVAQAATALGTYAPSRKPELLGAQLLDGPRGTAMVNGIDKLLSIVGYSNN
jgi:hypothetical protein